MREKEIKKIVKIEFASGAPDAKMIRIILQVMYEAAMAFGLKLKPKDVIYLEARRAISHKGARVKARLTRDIEAACQTIEAVWESL